ncbi:MAG: DNA topoisomerase IV subunit A, partial [Gammaproteobacteria bacterium]
NKAGKALFNLPDGAQILPPLWIENPNTDSLAVTAGDGRLLVFSASEIPTLNKGKGVRLINIPQARFASKQEYLHSVVVIPEGASVTLYAGRRHLTLKPVDIVHYSGERGKRGNKLPRGLQKVTRVELVTKD